MISDMVRGRRWADLADTLLELEGEQRETALCLILGTGRLEGLRAELTRRAGRVALPTMLRLLVADAGVRTQSVALYELLELDRQLQALEAPAVERLWMSTLLAEHGLWRGDLAAVGTRTETRRAAREPKDLSPTSPRHAGSGSAPWWRSWRTPTMPRSTGSWAGSVSCSGRRSAPRSSS